MAQEILHGERGGETRRAACGQHVIGAGEVIADGFGRMRAEKYRANYLNGVRGRMLETGDADRRS